MRGARGIEVGALWQGKYRILRHLARGGMGEVLLAKSVGEAGFERTVVLKVLPEELARHPRMIESFVLEARLCVRLQHPGIVQVFDLGREGNLYFLVMEYIRGHALSEILHHTRENQEPLPTWVCVHIVRALLEALQYAHEFTDVDGSAPGIVHRDISPSNVLVSSSGQVKLVDFGIAKVAAAAAKTLPGTLKGKFAYMAPEAILLGVIDPRYDLWSTGVLFYELLSGDWLFEGDEETQILHRVTTGKIPSLRDRRPDLPKPVLDVVNRALQIDPTLRWPTARAMIAALGSVEHATAEGGARLPGFIRELYGRRSFVRLAGALDAAEGLTTPIREAPLRIESKSAVRERRDPTSKTMLARLPRKRAAITRPRPPDPVEPEPPTSVWAHTRERVEPPIRPRASPPALRVPTSADPEPTAASLAAARILVLSDREEARTTMRSLLEAQGFVVFELASAIGATREIQRRKINVIIVDMGPPGLRASRVAALFRTNARVGSRGLVVVSSGTATELSTLASEAGADFAMSLDDVGKELVRAVRSLAARRIL